MEIFILNFIPKSCPSCGTRFVWNRSSSGDFLCGASHSCNNCGVKFQYVREDTLVKTAQDAGGDMRDE